jgi:dihydroorotate dehydrogenase (fumarate)
MAGANVTMMTSELLQKGPDRIGEMLSEMEEREYESVAQMRGSMSQQNVADPSAPCHIVSVRGVGYKFEE